MDKLMNTPWFIRVVALLLAVLLYISVSYDPETTPGGLGFSTPAKSDEEVIEDVPVELYYDRENLVVTGAPETVDVKLQGVKSLLLSAKNNREFKVYIDLSDPEITLGRKQVPIKIRDISDKLKATIEPTYANITIQEKVTKEFSVEPEFNRSLLEEGYLAEEPTVSPAKVKITGAKDIIDQISYVKATVELNGTVNDTVYRQAKVRALDRELNKLDVSIEPEIVDVKVPIKIPSKSVAITPIQKGNPKDGYVIKSISISPNTLSLFGKKSVLDSIDTVEVPFDVNGLDQDTELNIPVSLPEGVKTASTPEVKVIIDIEKVDEAGTTLPDGEGNENTEVPSEDISRTFQNVKIRYVGLGKEFELAFLSPQLGTSNVTISGSSTDVNSIKVSDILLSLNVEGLEEGEHELPLILNVPNSVKGNSGIDKAWVSITRTTQET
jgi:YbbR domain-containing protein